MKAYKGFKKNADGTLQCRDFQYEVGTTYKYDGEISLCENGFHACLELHQVWQFYSNNGKNVFYEVECGGEIIESKLGDGKFVCSEITLLKEVDVSNVAKFEYCWTIIKDFAAVRLNGKWNFINAKGELLSEQWFDNCCNFNEGFAVVKLNGKYNFINTKGVLLSDQWFDNCCVFNEGFAAVVSNGQWNFINTKGEILSPNQWFEDCGKFRNGFAIVELDDKYKYINTKGEIFNELC